MLLIQYIGLIMALILLSISIGYGITEIIRTYLSLQTPNKSNLNDQHLEKHINLIVQILLATIISLAGAYQFIKNTLTTIGYDIEGLHSVIIYLPKYLEPNFIAMLLIVTSTSLYVTINHLKEEREDINICKTND